MIVLRPLVAADLPAAHRLSSGFAWPHRLEDWTFMAAAGHGIAAEAEGRLIGTALCWHFGATAAFAGLVCVDPAQQGRGTGRRLMAALLQRLEGRTVLLHATEAGRPLYERLGFVANGTITQLQGLAAPNEGRAGPRGEMRPVTPADLGALCALDAVATGLDRSDLLGRLLRCSEGAVLMVHGQPGGFVLWRPFGRGMLIGPVVAPDHDGARTLIAHALSRTEGVFTRIDVPTGSGLVDWLPQFGLVPVDTGLRMVRGPCPLAGPVRPALYALGSQAFG